MRLTIERTVSCMPGAVMSKTRNIEIRIRVAAAPAAVYERFATDAGRETFLCESSRSRHGRSVLRFPNGESTAMRVTGFAADRRIEFDYFGDSVCVEFRAGDAGTVVELRTAVAARDHAEILAGWVSVLLALKAAVDHGVDLRNHEPALSWDNGFVDN